MKTETIEFLKKILALPGLSGYEKPVADIIAETWKPLVDEIQIARSGSIQALKRGEGEEPRPRLLIAAHMDAIGLMVSQIVDGFLRITEIGGIDDRVLPGQLVRVHGRQEIPGVIVQPPDHFLSPDKQSRPVEKSNLYVDTGLLPGEVEKVVRVGDLVSFALEPFELPGDVVVGHSQDDRAAIAALTICLDNLKVTRHAWDVWVVATTQEEETYAGAYSAPYNIRPDLAIAVDVTFARGPGANDYRAFHLGKGIVLGWGPNIHPAVFNALKETADKQEIPYSLEVMPRHSGTDAFAMQVVSEGIPTMVVGIPLRYMHTPVEAVSTKDIQRAGNLLSAFIAQLGTGFVSQINWED
jgi:endoglucanase